MSSSDLTGAEQTRKALFERIYRENYEDVLKFVLRRTTVEAAQDVVADTFVVVWRRLDNLPRNSRPWLLGIARNLLANQRRSQARQASLPARVATMEAASSPPPEPTDESRVMSALARLPFREREAILLIAWEQLTPAEAATVAGCSAVAFRVRLHRVRRRLANELDESSPVGDRRLGDLQPFPKEVE